MNFKILFYVIVGFLVFCDCENKSPKSTDSKEKSEVKQENQNSQLKQVKGEIVGVLAKVALNELTTGNIKTMAYSGEIVVMLPDSEEVNVICTKDLLSNVKGCPIFNSNNISGGIVATITVGLKEHQEIQIVRNKSDNWEVEKILK